jgi:hypothetical protein
MGISLWCCIQNFTFWCDQNFTWSIGSWFSTNECLKG